MDTGTALKIVCISDTHGHRIDVPDGDLLIHAGDITLMGLATELAAAMNWFHALPHPRKIVVAGNHDWCMTDEAEYLTPSGWKHFGQSTDEPIATLNPLTAMFEWQYPIKFVVNEHWEGDLVAFRGRKISHIVTPNHDVVVRPYVPPGRFQKVRKDGLMKVKAGRYPRGNWATGVATADGWQGKSPTVIDIPRSQRRGGFSIGAPEFAELAGWYVSEGSADEARVSLCQKRGTRYYADIISLVRRLGFEPQEGEQYVRFGCAPLAQFLRQQFGHRAQEKQIPSWVKDWSSGLLRLIVRTMIKGDGNDQGGYVQYTTASDRLADDLQEIAAKIGWGCYIGPRADFPFGDTGYIGSARRIGLHIKHPHPFLRNPKHEPYRGLVWCPVVANGIWLSRHGGHSLWTGNSFQKEPALAKRLVETDGRTIYLQDTAVRIDGLSVYGSPWTPQFMGWAFEVPRGKEMRKIWSRIPDKTDILITHGPPHLILDRTEDDQHVGCVDLARRVGEVLPFFHIFGHIHPAYGQVKPSPSLPVTFVNAAICDDWLMVRNRPVVLDFDEAGKDVLLL